MERLTEFWGGIWGMSKQAIEDGYDKYSVFSKLAAYEDAGLTPQEIEDIKTIKQERDFWEREAKKNCAKLGEQRIKLQQVDCEGIAKDKNGKCLGYCYSETDDEPIEACKYCELYESYEDI